MHNEGLYTKNNGLLILFIIYLLNDISIFCMVLNDRESWRNVKEAIVV